MAHRDIRVEAEWNEDIDLALLARALLEHVRLTEEAQNETAEAGDQPDAEAA